MTMPNFFIIGAQKAGTTSLYHYLDQHPQIYMSPAKEPFFFNHEINSNGELVREKFGGPGRSWNPVKFTDNPVRFSNLEEYRALFEGVTDEKAIGEASVLYLYTPGTAERIKKYVPEAKVIALLRNPADRAYSAFLNAVRGGREPLYDFAQALREEDGRIRDNWHYVYRYRDRGLYYGQLKRYYDVFDREKIGVWLYEDLSADPSRMVQSVFRFLGVDDAFVPDTSSKHNPGSVPKNEVGRQVIRFMNTALPIVRKVIPPASKVYREENVRLRKIVQKRALIDESPPLDAEIRAELIEFYREDILRLEDLIGRDLSLWLR
jgi:sulfotransferase family protein